METRCAWRGLLPTRAGAAQKRVLIPIIGAYQLLSLLIGHRISLEGLRRNIGQSRRLAARDIEQQIVKEIRNGDIKYLRDLVQAALEDAIHSEFIFMNMLKRRVYRLTVLRLPEHHQGASRPNTLARMNIDINRFICHR